MFIIIDNYDSFTANLVHAFAELKLPYFDKAKVIQNDDPKLLALATNKDLKAVCLSSGFNRPGNTGFCKQFLSSLPNNIPVLGIGLGHHILADFSGATLIPQIMHGRQVFVSHDGESLFRGISPKMVAGLYTSFKINSDNNPEFECIASSEKFPCLALAYKKRPWFGIQFNPESVLTPQGGRILKNFAEFSLQIQNNKTPYLLNEQKNNLETTELKERSVPVPINEILEQLARGQNLAEDTAYQVFSRLMDGELSNTQAATLLLALRMKGETPSELFQAMNCVLDRSVEIPHKDKIIKETVIDIVGTGGDGHSSFNCSTGTALILAGMGHKVLKHGNRSVSSRCGSADVLEVLGIPLNLPPEDIYPRLQKDKFVFLFAPLFHPTFKNVMPIRRELGIRTMFNILGPLVNPARPPYYMIGVPNPELLPLLAGALSLDGHSQGAVICGCGSYDELTPIGPAQVIFVEGSKMQAQVLDPKAYGFKPCTHEDLKVTDPEQAAQVLKELLQGKGPKAMQDMLAFNVGLALHILNRSKAITVCMQEAKDAVKSSVGKKFISNNTK
ncbi:anthranilate phosphoribosyltransferase [Desulfovibrio litoralis]|uniref:Anthranilate phosphoribosyltransferase n=1 Tax=Desulfovibrio litoralis DSM 11393 TaxID=1121455 RepID=A0A1M7RW66_9BACT|nr:anthranilate phosphoribosyltransferase [Desulfovibrio litoralis]SHN50607.1 anthranilate synthase/phosphoribosyltransferase [Desulfovibrio litoralis DSM 11393]